MQYAAALGGTLIAIAVGNAYSRPLSSLMWKLAGRTIDQAFPLVFRARKNLDLGWGGEELRAVLSSWEGMRAEAASSGSVAREAPTVRWEGPWREQRLAAAKADRTIIGLVKGWLTGEDNQGAARCSSVLIRDGLFPSPIADLLPDGAKDARFRVVVPKAEGVSVSEADDRGLWGVEWGGAVCLQFPATGDEGYGFRFRSSAAPLAVRHGVASVLLMQAYYGKRRPLSRKGKVAMTVESVAEVCLMAQATIEEGLSLTDALARGGGKVCVTGISLGGALASCVAGLTPHRIAAAPCLAGISASAAWVEGKLSTTVDWPALCTADAPVPLPEATARLLASGSWSEGVPEAELPSRAGAPEKGGGRGELGVSLAPSTPEEAKDTLHALLEAIAACVPPPKAPHAVVFCSAEDDMIITPASTHKLGAKFGVGGDRLRFVPGGHATSFMLAHRDFRAAVVDSLALLRD